MPIVRDAWSRGQALSVHGWIYDIRDGIIRDLGVRVTADGTVSARSFTP
jgi:carbonic anhydrase